MQNSFLGVVGLVEVFGKAKFGCADRYLRIWRRQFFPELIFPRSGKSALLLWSHKLLRWLSPLFAMIANSAARFF